MLSISLLDIFIYMFVNPSNSVGDNSIIGLQFNNNIYKFSKPSNTSSGKYVIWLYNSLR